MTTAPNADFPGELRVYGDAEQLAHAAAEVFAKVASESISARGRFRVALSGGSTPAVCTNCWPPQRSVIAWIGTVSIFSGGTNATSPPMIVTATIA